jgi:acetyltransferase
VKNVYFSKVVSYGNACDLNEADFLEYFAHDPQTKIIVAYIEGTRDGRRFIEALREATKAKPVILVKGGITEAGTKAVASHTGALAGSNTTWDALFHQLGVMQVDDLEELIDLALLFQHLQPPRGRRGGLVGTGGGFSVLATDNCESEGLTIPPLPQEVRNRLREIIPEEVDPGTSVRNPVDLSGSGWNPEIFSPSLRVLANYDGVDFILTYTAVAFGLYRGTNWMIDGQMDSLIEAKKDIDKPIALVLRHSGDPESAQYASSVQKRCIEAGIPVFPSFSRAARAINRFIRYHEMKEGSKSE